AVEIERLLAQGVLAAQTNVCTGHVERDRRQLQDTATEGESSGEVRCDAFLRNIRLLPSRAMTQLGDLLLNLGAGEPPVNDREASVQAELLDDIAVPGRYLEACVQTQGADERRLRSVDREPEHIFQPAAVDRDVQRHAM